MNGQDGDSGGESASGEITGAIRDGLQDVVIKKFIVEPPAIVIGSSVVVAWQVVFAENIDAELHLNGVFVTTFGDKHFTPTQTTTFKLSMVFADGTERGLASRGVRVDPVDCQNRFIVSGLITNPIKVEFDKRFSVAGELTLRDNGSIVTLGDNRINIMAPAEINVPNWFNANLDLAITLSVRHISTSAGSPIGVNASKVNFDVDWSFLENLASLGCGHLVELGMSKLGQVFMVNIVSAELVPRIAGELNGIANSQLALVQQADPQQRPHKLAVAALSPDGLSFRICPA